MNLRAYEQHTYISEPITHIKKNVSKQADTQSTYNRES